MRLSEIKQTLRERQIQLTKALGQNFLTDGNQLRRIVAAAEIQPSDHVLEIGPGLGSLTELLVARAGSVLAVEKDKRLCALVREKFAGVRQLTLLQADALAYLQPQARDWSEWKVVANLPYSVASALLVELARAQCGPKLLVVTLQLEVAQRMVARAGDADYGLLSLLIQLSYEPQGSFRIPATCFFPSPKVDSACIKFARRLPARLPGSDREVFEAVVRRGFSQRRKTLRKLLRADWPEAALGAAFERLGLSPQIRAEAVTLDQFIQLAGLLRAPVAATISASRSSPRTQTAPASVSPATTGRPSVTDGSQYWRPANAAKEEVFDIVNERDEVIGQRSRREVHRLGLKHRAVHVLIFNRSGQVFLQKRSLSKDNFPGVWDSSASGHLDTGEDYDPCAVREVREELGVDLDTVPMRLFKIDACPETGEEFCWIYRCAHEGPFTLHPEEIERGGWFEPSFVSRWIAERPEEFAGGLRVIWEGLKHRHLLPT